MRKQSVEFKAELRDPELARFALKHAGATWAETRAHKDTYFRVPDRRLKRREAEHEPTEYFLYERRDAAHPMLSRFSILSEEEFYERFGEKPLPVRLAVGKTREIWLTGAARVHLDHIQPLGHFIEIETLVSKNNNLKQCHDEIARVRDMLAPALGGTITTSYADLIDTELNSDADDRKGPAEHA